MRFLLALPILQLALSATLFAQDTTHQVPPAEGFVLTRQQMLARLIPGTPDYFYYHALDAQLRLDLKKSAELLDAWDTTGGTDARYATLRQRQRLLGFKANPQRTCEDLASELGFAFNHQRPGAAAAQVLPAALEADFFNTKTGLGEILRYDTQLLGVSDDALPLLIPHLDQLSNYQRPALLQRLAQLQRPDFPGAVRLIAAELKATKGDFNSVPLCQQLSLAQLQELARLRPEMPLDQAWALAVGQRLLFDYSPEEHQIPLERFLAFADFARGLPPAQAEIKAAALCHLLFRQEQTGRFDAALLAEYLALPRRSDFLPEGLRKDRNLVFAQMNASILHLAPVENLEPALLRRHLLHHLSQSKAAFDADHDPVLAPFTPVVEASRLKRLYAEARLCSGAIDPLAAAALLAPAELQQLRDSIEVELAMANPDFSPSEGVPSLLVQLKNTPQLLIRTWRIDAAAYYREHHDEALIGFDLDGLAPSSERQLSFAQPPVLRHAEQIPLEECSGPGLFVVELIGNGHAVRAVIRKGQLSTLLRSSAAGQLLFVRDEKGRPVAGASVEMGATHFTTDDQGRVAIPYAPAEEDAGPHELLVSHGALATSLKFTRETEKPALEAAFQFLSDNLVPGRSADLNLQPRLLINGRPASLDLLKDLSLTITWQLQGGGSSSERFELKAAELASLKIHPPAQAVSGRALLQASLPAQTARKDHQLQQEAYLTVLNPGTAIASFLVRKDGPATVLELRGANGEVLPGRIVSLRFHGSVWQNGLSRTLKTDAAGRIHLGVLPANLQISAHCQGASRSWSSSTLSLQIASTQHLKAGENIQIARPTSTWTPALIRLVEDAPAEDLSAALKLDEAHISLPPLKAGDYLLRLDGSRAISLVVRDGERLQGLLQTPSGTLMDAPVPSPLALLASHRVEGQELILSFTAPATGLSLAAAQDLQMGLATLPNLPLLRSQSATESNSYLDNKILDGELRYILDRRAQGFRLGVMLDKPGLLLNPRELGDSSAIDPFMADGIYGAVKTFGGHEGKGRKGGLSFGGYAGAQERSNKLRGFLTHSPWLRSGLATDAKNELRLPLESLGDRNQLLIVGGNGDSSWQRLIALPLPELAITDSRLATGLPTDRRFAVERGISLLKAGQTLKLNPAAASSLAAISSLAGLMDFYAATGKLGPQLEDWRPLTQWDKLDEAAKLAFYETHACHELHLFLLRRDKAFFDSTILPFLKNIKEPSFCDALFTGADLRSWLQPDVFVQLNPAEKALFAALRSDAAVSREMADALRLLPPAHQKLDQLFNSLLAGKDSQAMDGDKSQQAMAKMSAEKSSRGRQAQNEALMPPPPPPPAPVAVMEAEAADPFAASDDSVTADSPAAPASAMRGALKKEAGARRAAKKPLYVELGKTLMYAEASWWKTELTQPPSGSPAHRKPGFPALGFWADAAAHAQDRPFVSPQLIQAQGSLNEALLAIALTDLPFADSAPDLAAAAKDGALLAKADLALVQSTLSPDAAPLQEIALIQRFFAQDDAAIVEQGQSRLKIHSGPFQTGKVYGCEVVLSNASDRPRDITLLTQIPSGALSVGGKITDTRSLHLDPFQTISQRYFFYFPAEGSFIQAPAQACAQVGERMRVIGAASPATFSVSNATVPPALDTWSAVAAQGSTTQILNWLKTKPLAGEDLSLCAHLMDDKDAYKAVLHSLRQRHLFDRTLWSYSLYHQDGPAIAELLAASSYSTQVGLAFDSELLKVDAIRQNRLQQRDFKPLINVRQLPVNGQRLIPNDQFLAQYSLFLDYLSQKSRPAAEDELALCCALLLQDRLEEAATGFAKIDRNQLQEQLQYDYMACYLKLAQGHAQEAAALAKMHLDCPALHWRRLFAQVAEQCADIAQGSLASSAAEGPADAPELFASITGAEVKIHAAKLQSISIAVYPVDLELLFSRQPFAFSEEAPSEAPVVTPLRSFPVQVDAAGDATFTLPEDLRRSNLILQVQAPGLQRQLSYQPHSFESRVIGAQGQIQVVAAGKPLARAYVKVFARRHDGTVVFHKDGYTDLRGRFDYASTNEGTRGIDSFALLVLTPENGAATLSAPVPTR